MGIKPVIVVVAYNRDDSLRRLLESIGNAYFSDDDISLIISIDYSDVNEKVLEVANSFEWKYGEKRIINHQQNLGLRKHILECGDYAVQYGAVIILEDDLVVAPDFYNFAKQAQEFYKQEERVAGVALYSHAWNGYVRRRFAPVMTNGDVYFGQFSITWGQCWTKEQWSCFKEWYNAHPNLDKQSNMPDNIWQWSVNSWGKYFVYYILDTNKYYVIPYKALSTCFSEAGVHIKNISLDNQVCLFYGAKEYEFVQFESGAHYDIFFENMDLKENLKKYTGGNTNICINLYGKKNEAEEKADYILTTQKRNEKSVKSFGLQMRPWEMNVLYDIAGDEIFLYKNEGKYDKKSKKNSFDVINYEAQGMPWQVACKYGVCRALKGAELIFRRYLKK